MSPTPDSMLADPQQIIANLRRELDECRAERDKARHNLNETTTERDEALAREIALAEVLDAINHSSGDVTPVFEAILDKAHRFCGAEVGTLAAYDGEQFHALATLGYPEQFAALVRHPFRPNIYMQRLVDGERVVYLPDQRTLESQPDGEATHAFFELTDLRTTLFVALRKDASLLGFISAHRHGVRPFSEKEIALLEAFAAQAAIALENARLLGELRERTSDLQESLECQTATSDVLKVISRSTFDLKPVLDTLVATAARLCEAEMAIIHRRDGEVYRPAAWLGFPAEFIAFLESHPISPGRESIAGRVALERRAVHIADVAADPEYTLTESTALAEQHSALGVPLLRQDELIGVIVLARQRVEPFTDTQIKLVCTFADQAVIAIENTRLLTETREALEQQTATAEVLQVINSSPGDLVPVFDAMLEKAVRLCEAVHGHLWRYDGEYFHPATAYGEPQFVRWFEQRGPVRPNPHGDGFLGRIARGEHVLYIADVKETEAYRIGSPQVKALVELSGGRSVITIALRKEDTLVGAMTVYRQEVRPFSDKQIALLQNFAAQAVIAMENARLITETREAFEQQTATAEILQVINSSPGDLAPVFDAMLEKATRFCEGTQGILWTYDGERFRPVAMYGVAAEFAAFLEQGVRPGPRAPIMRILRGERLVEIIDLAADHSYQAGEPLPRAAVEIGGFRSMIFVALVKDETLLGAFAIARQEVRAFTEKQIALAENFAAQAVIAMENARLLDQIRQRQAELRVTFDNMADGVAMFDEDLRLTAWNRNFQEILDMPDALLLERPSYAEYLHVLAERGEFGTDNIDAELSRRLEDTDQEFRSERTRPDGRVIEVRRNSVPNGGFVLIYSDITERKRSEAEIHAARDAAETAYRDLKAAQASLIQAEKMASLGQLTAGIAHEIKNPLNFVNNFAGLSVELLDELKDTAAPAIAALEDEKRAEIGETIEMLTGNLEKIAEHGRRADNIVKSMLEHSRGTSGERRSVDLNGLIEETLNLAYHGGRAQDQSFNITLERDFADAIAPIEVVPQDITRVCLNLFGNGFYAATKRQREGGDPNFKPTLKVSTRDLGDGVEIRVRDNGTGIPTEIKDKLFQPFFTTKPTGEGTGLGLSISYDIVTQQHGGTITVDSKVGEFTEFTVRLPRSFLAASTGAAAWAQSARTIPRG